MECSKKNIKRKREVLVSGGGVRSIRGAGELGGALQI